MRSHLFRALFSFWRQTKRLSPPQLQERLHQPAPPLILDVRTNDEFVRGHIPGAVLVPVDELQQQLSELASYREQSIVTV